MGALNELGVPKALAKKITAHAEYSLHFRLYTTPIRKQILDALEKCQYPKDAGWDSQARMTINFLARAAPSLKINGLTHLWSRMDREDQEQLQARALLLGFKLQQYPCVLHYDWTGQDNLRYQKNAEMFNEYVDKRLEEFPWREHIMPIEVKFIDAAAQAVRAKSVFTFKVEG